MGIKIRKVSEVVDASVVNMLVYGISGIGKTVLGSTAPKPLFLSAEDGLLSLKDTAGDIDVTEITSEKDLEEVLSFLRTTQEYETVVIDSLSEFSQTLLASLKDGERDKRQAYGKMADSILYYVRQFRKLPLHTVFIAKQVRIQDEASGRMLYAPKFPGKVLDSEMDYQLDEVFAMRFKKFDGKEYRVLQTQPDIEYSAKDRSGKLNMWEKPDLTAIIEKITQTTEKS